MIKAFTIIVFLMFNEDLPYETQAHYVRQSLAQVKAETGVTLKPRFIIQKHDPCGWVDDESWIVTAFNRHTCLEEKLPNKTKLRFVVSPAREVGYSWQLLGVASGICKRTGLAYFTAIDQWWLGRGMRSRLARVGIAHEIGHLIGASHTEDMTVMNYKALGAAQSGLHFSTASKREIKSCVGGW